MQTYAYGFPRLGKNREFKKSIESFWENAIDEKGLIARLNAIEEARTCSGCTSNINVCQMDLFSFIAEG